MGDFIYAYTRAAAKETAHVCVGMVWEVRPRWSYAC
jgi:hypothetical protein